VIIPTHNRRDLIGEPLRALAKQTIPAEELEVIVVADGCSDGTFEMLREASYPFEFQLLSQPASGAATARNRGAAAARAKLLILIDDDVVPGPGAVEAHLRHHEEHPNTVGIGPYLLDPPKRPSLLLEARARWWEKQFTRIGDSAQPTSYEDLLPGNLSISRSDFQSVGGFATEFQKWGSEDYELGVRLIKAGYKIMLVPGARARHLQTLSLRSDFGNMQSSGGTSVIFARLHPDIAPTLWLSDRWRVDWFAESFPRLGDALAPIVLKVLTILDRTSCRKLFGSLHRQVRRYAYARGAQLERDNESVRFAEPPARNGPEKQAVQHHPSS